MVNIETLSNKLTSILKDEDLPEDYTNIIQNALKDETFNRIVSDDDINDLSDVEIFEILDKLKTYAKDSTDESEKENLNEIIKALTNHIYQDDTVSNDEYEPFDPINLEKIHTSNDITSDVELKTWVDNITSNDDSFGSIKQAFPLLPIEDQIKILNYYGEGTDNYNYALELLNDEQKQEIQETKFTDLLNDLPLQDENNNDISPSESLKAFFDANTSNKDALFEKITNGDIILDNTQLEYLWDYLANADETEQKDFLSKIKPYSAVHLSLIETLNGYNEDEKNDDETDSSNRQNRYRNNLQNLSDAIIKGDGDLSDINLSLIFPNKDEDSPIINDIFGNVSDIIDNGGYSEILSDFLASGKFEKTDIQTFIASLSPEEIQDFSGALFSDSSPILSLIKQENGRETVNSILENLFSAFGDDTITNDQRINFLKGIDQTSEFYSSLENQGYDNVTELIDASQEDDFDASNFNEKDIKDFFVSDLAQTGKNWYGTETYADILDELSNATESKDINAILKKAKKEDNLDTIFNLIASDSFEGGSPEFYNSFFKTLRSNSDYADSFFENIDINSNLGRTLTQLSDNKTKPFDDISYDINSETGKIDFGSDQRKLLTILSNSKQEGINIFFDTLDTIQNEFDGATGTDNKDVKKLIENAQKNTLDNTFFDTLFSSTDGDTTNAEDILDILSDDDNILFKSLNTEQLSNFIDKFSAWITTQGTSESDNLLNYLGDGLSEDSLLYKALIKAGGDEKAFVDGDYKKFFNSATDTQDAADFIKQSLKFNNQNDNFAYVTESLKGTKKSSDIDNAVTNILDYATANGQAIDDLITDIASGGGILSSLTTDQAKALVEGVFNYITDQEPEDGEDLSEAAFTFIDSLTENSPAYALIQKEYPAIANYLGIASNDEDDEAYDDNDIANELDDLLNDKQLINSYAKKSNGTNDTFQEDDTFSSDDSSVNNDNKSYKFIEDDTELNSEDNKTKDSETDDDESHNNSDREDYSKAADAALGVLGKKFDVSGEPDFETGILSSFFFENNSVEDLANAATDGNFDTKEVIGTLQLIPLDKQADFIREYIGNGDVDQETQDYLLGRLLISAVNGDVGNRTIDAILKDVGIDNLTYDDAKKIIDNWSETIDKYTDASATSIDDTYEKVLSGIEKFTGPPNNFSPNKTISGLQNDILQSSPDLFASFYGNGYPPYGGSPYGVGGFSPYSIGGFSGLNPYGTGGFSPYGVNPYGAGFASVASEYASENPANIIINANNPNKNDVNVSVASDGSLSVNRSGTRDNSTLSNDSNSNKEDIKSRRQSDE